MTDGRWIALTEVICLSEIHAARFVEVKGLENGERVVLFTYIELLTACDNLEYHLALFINLCDMPEQRGFTARLRYSLLEEL